MIELRTLGVLDLRGVDGQEIRAVLTQPKRVALLAYLAIAAPHGFHRRDTLLGLFWPELDQQHARASLRKAVHALRHALGEGVVIARGDEELAIDDARLWCDAVAFERALSEGRAGDAMALYRGNLLDGVFVSGAPEFERWLDAQRTELRTRATSGAWSIADHRERAGDFGGALQWARRALALSPDDETALRRVIALLDRVGDRAGALHTYEDFAQRLEREYEVEPAPETTALIAAVRTRVARVSGDRVQGPLPSPAAGPAGAASRRAARWRTTLVGASALLLLAIALSVYLGMRALGIGPPGTLVAAGVIDPRERIILADFENHSGDTLLDAAVTEAFRIDLAQSPLVVMARSEELRRVLTQMRRGGDAPLTLPLAREVAIRQGLKAVIAGEIRRVGGSYVLSVQLVAAQGGDVLAAFRETAPDATAILGAVDRLSRRLRARIGDSLRSIRGAEPLEQVTTASLEALRKYSLAVRASERAGDYAKAIVLLQEATALDTGFAMAYRKLGIIFFDMFEQRTREVEALTKAFQHRDRMTDRERYLTIAAYYGQATHELDKEIPALRALLETYPDDRTALTNLAWAHIELRDYAPADTLTRRAIEIDSASATLLEYVMAMVARVGLGRLDAAQDVIDQAAARLPGNPTAEEYGAAFASSRGQYERAAARIRALQEAQRASLFWQASTSADLGALAAVRGRLADSERHLHDAMAANEARGLAAGYVTTAIQLSSQEVLLRHDAAGGLRVLDAALRRHPLATMGALDRPYLALAIVYGLAGRADRARALVAEYDAAVARELQRGEAPLRHSAAGLLALSERRYADAIAEFRRSDDGVCPICALALLGKAYDVAGEGDSALAVYERYVTTPWPTRVFGPFSSSDPLYLAAMYERLGELYEARGQTDKAIGYYAQFAALWHDADSELQPRVAEAQRRLARLRRAATTGAS
jgi:eukaryotic-like serine/threonine-protein kinase